MRYLIAFLALAIAVTGLASGAALVWPSITGTLYNALPWMPWDQFIRIIPGQDSNTSAAIIAGVGVLAGFTLNALYFALRTRRTSERFSILNLMSGFFWGTVIVAIAAGLYLLAYYTYIDASLDTEGGPRRVKVHWTIAVAYHGYFWLIDTIGRTATAGIALLLSLLTFWGGLAMIANGDVEEEEDEATTV